MVLRYNEARPGGHEHRWVIERERRFTEHGKSSGVSESAEGSGVPPGNTANVIRPLIRAIICSPDTNAP